MNETIKSIIEDAANKALDKFEKDKLVGAAIGQSRKVDILDGYEDGFIDGANHILQNKSLFSPAGEWRQGVPGRDGTRCGIFNKCLPVIIDVTSGVATITWPTGRQEVITEDRFEDLEWLDPNPSSASPDIQKLVEALRKILRIIENIDDYRASYALDLIEEAATEALNNPKP